MYNHGLRGFIIAFVLAFLLTFQGCSNIVTPKFAVIFSISIAAIAGVIGLLIGKQVKSEDIPSEMVFFKRYQAFVYASLILVAGLVVSFIENPDMLSKEPSQKLKGHLENLDGTWAWVSKKSESTFYLGICFDPDSKSGEYDLASLSDNWESQEQAKMHKIRKNKFNLVNGYDMYGDKAYVGKDIETGKPMFVIALIDSPNASEWHLRLSMVEDDMFGEKMLKINNDCHRLSK